jgi:hypothetical protein
MKALVAHWFQDSITRIVAERYKTKSGPVVQNSKAIIPVPYANQAARIFFLDIPVFLILLLCASMVWVRHVRDHYLLPQYQSAEFNDNRSWNEITYYKRECDANDLTTTNGADLFLPYDASVDDAYQHNLKHGFTVFRRGLSEETAMTLRTYIDKRNRNLKESEKIFTLEQKNRVSFALGTEEPSVVAALKEIALSPLLRPALEKVLGPDPALIEMTAITSLYGAKAQDWHDDVVNSGSAINFGRSFGPIYGLFIQLQNTTAAMGATAACPGTHYCSHGDFDDICTKHGFQIANENGHWGIGDALLMNQNSFHSGAAHTDPNAIDRVMMILSFTPKPTRRSESRMMSQGITFSLRWDMWGHTLNDLASADTSMRQPWALLRALGLYKRSGASWGIDYISGATMRLANNDYGIFDSNSRLHFGGFGIPKWLEAKVDPLTEEGNWFVYINGTFELCFKFVETVCASAVVAYLTFFVKSAFPPRKIKVVANSSSAIFRLSILLSIVSLIYFRAKKYVDESEWAIDIKAGRRYSSTTPLEQRTFVSTLSEYISHSTAELHTTLPNKLDVLIETRYGGKQLALYNDFINNHPGNEYIINLIKQQSTVFRLYPSLFQNATSKFITNAIEARNGRFLLQNPNGYWIWMSHDDSIRYVHNQLLRMSNPLLNDLLWTIRLMDSDKKYGEYRDCALYLRHTSIHLKKLKTIFTDNYVKWNMHSNVLEKPSPKQNNIFSTLRSFSTSRFRPLRYVHSEVLHRIPIDLDFQPTEPEEDAWITTNDEVETWADNYWYYGVVKNVSAHISYNVAYENGSEEGVGSFAIRRFDGYYVGEELEVIVGDTYYPGVIREFLEDGDSLSVWIPELRRTLHYVSLSQLRRYGPAKYNPPKEVDATY